MPDTLLIAVVVLLALLGMALLVLLFRSLAANALERNTRQFLDLAEQRLAVSREQAAGDLEERRRGIETLLAPLRETLGKLESRTAEIEKTREGAYRGLEQQIRLLHEATTTLQDRTTTLATALRSGSTRGRWGELALRNIVELAGMTEHCDFLEQKAAADGKRPDMTVKLPGGRIIAVDAKAPLDAYLDAAEAVNDAARDAALTRHVAALRGHIRALASRDYAAGLGGGVDLVVLFLPGDPFLSAAFSRDPNLQVEAMRSRVLVAVPTTLVALLRTVAIYWQQRSMAENAEAIYEAAEELYARTARFGEHLAKTGKGLRDAVKAYNAAVGSFETRLLPMGQKLEDVKVAEQLKRKLETPGLAEVEPREPTDRSTD